MKKEGIILMLLISSVVLGQEIKGKIKNYEKETSFSLRNLGNRTIKQIDVDTTGVFDSGKIDISDGYYILRKNNEMVYLYLKKNDDVTISFDAKDLVNTISFSGRGANANEYLITKRKLYIESKKATEKFYKVDENQYLEQIKVLNNEVKDILISKKLEDVFFEKEKENLKYDYLLDLYNYENLQKFYFGKIVTPSENYLKPLNVVNYDDADLYNTIPGYKSLASLKWKKNIEKAKDIDEMNMLFNNIKTNALKLDVLISFYYGISKTPERSKEYYKLIRKYVTNPVFLKEAKKLYKNVNKTKEGEKSPSFKYENVNGKIVELTDFIGKYVFIDVWATWCLPCMQQIPYIKKLEEKYHGKNIVFIGVSVDKKDKYSLWKETILSKKMKGIQLFSDDSFQSKFIEAFSISSIPRFILISPEGIILNPNMSKPSDERTAEYLDELFK
ncbi:TlpA family protein disulfide reductase [Tenacibaculum ovolyticum]|uniref:TlpA family protein disulfide reductase n=1 Tax=Tenacibaculum ovolyticum TaxID=104270 RepID=UPI003BAAB116